MNKKEYQFIENCKLGDDSAKEYIYKRYAPVLLGVCLRYINNRMQAEDIIQESFITAFEKINQLKNNASIEWWLKRIVINNALRFLKSQQYESDINDINEITIDSGSESGGGAKGEILKADISQEDILLVISSLPTGFKTVFNLYVFENYKHHEIAEKLGISQGTSKSQLLRARKLIQKKLFELIKEREKKKKKKVFLSSSIITMDNNFEYIDKLAKEKLGNFTKVPLTGVEKIISVTSNISQSTTLGIKAKLLTLISKKVILITSVVVSTTGITYLIINNNNPDNDNKVITAPAVKQNDKGNLKIETVNNNIEDVQKTLQKEQKQITTKSNKIKTTNKNTKAHHKTIHIKKVIKVKKQKIIIDTIKKTDTLRIKR
jgi:RNA polymerase sigma-70 factor (ECF subfamily)